METGLFVLSLRSEVSMKNSVFRAMTGNDMFS